MGKTALATAALYDPRIVARFGRRRTFTSLEAAIDPRVILAKLVEALGLPATGDEDSLLRILEANAGEGPLAAILDNAETVFDADRERSERLLSLVSQVKGLSLVATIRGVAPPIAGAFQIDDLSKLSETAARQAFLAVGGNSLKDDPNLQHLLEMLDGHALSIRLVAAQAIGLPSLQGLRESWDEAHAGILRMSGEEERRLTSVRASLALSLNSRRMKSMPLSRRLLALIAFLPGGLRETDAQRLLGDRATVSKAKANEAITCLHQLRLVERRPDQRLRMLTPLRECAKVDVPPLPGDKKRLIDRYLVLASKANAIGTRSWQTLRDEIEPEADNLDAICEIAVLAGTTHKFLEDALEGLKDFHMLSGKGAVGSIDRVVTRARNRPASGLLARCTAALAEIAWARSNVHMARLRFEEALTLYRRLKDKIGEAACIEGLGDVASASSDYKLARALYAKALAIYTHEKDVLGKAHCIEDLAAVSIVELDYASASIGYVTAQSHYRQLGNLLGEANCIERLGDIARIGSEHDAALSHYNEALLLQRIAGNVLGQANCTKGLGDVARALGDRESACSYFEGALLLFRRIGQFGSAAEAMIRLGQEQQLKDPVLGLSNIESGFALYFKISHAEDRAIEGFRAIHRALTSNEVNDKKNNYELARSAWTTIGRFDLIRDWVDAR